jgi:predicted transcriptional regulator
MSADDVAFLVRSPNRAAVLAELTEAPATRAELRERIGASRVTVGRITGDLVDRGWVTQTDGSYRATSAGRAVSGAYEQFRDTVETTRRLEPLLPYLPVERFDFELTALSDAELVVPDATDPSRHFTRLRELFADAVEVTMVVHAVDPEIVAAQEAATRAGDHHTRGVVTTDLAAAMRADEAVRDRIASAVAAGGLALSERPSVPFQAAMFEDIVAISADDEAGVPRGIVCSDAPAVRTWLRAEFERLSADATPISADSFGADADG